MGIRKSLSDEEKGKIKAFVQSGKSNREIALILKRSHNVTNQFVRDPDGYGSKKSPGRPRSLSDRQVRLVHRAASNKVTTLRQIKGEYDLPASRMALSNGLKRGRTIVIRKIKNGPLLQVHHKAARLQFTQRHIQLQTDWTKIIWSDEKRFCPDGPDGYNSYFHDLRKDPLVFSKRGFGGGTVMVWAAFCADGQVGLEIITPRMNSAAYQTVLGTHLLPFLNTAGHPGYVFQHDNASVHASRSTSQWLAAGGVRVLDWPACSPDLNPIENVWGILTQKW